MSNFTLNQVSGTIGVLCNKVANVFDSVAKTISDTREKLIARFGNDVVTPEASKTTFNRARALAAVALVASVSMGTSMAHADNTGKATAYGAAAQGIASWGKGNNLGTVITDAAGGALGANGVADIMKGNEGRGGAKMFGGAVLTSTGPNGSTIGRPSAPSYGGGYGGYPTQFNGGMMTNPGNITGPDAIRTDMMNQARLEIQVFNEAKKICGDLMAAKYNGFGGSLVAQLDDRCAKAVVVLGETIMNTNMKVLPYIQATGEAANPKFGSHSADRAKMHATLKDYGFSLEGTLKNVASQRNLPQDINYVDMVSLAKWQSNQQVASGPNNGW